MRKECLTRSNDNEFRLQGTYDQHVRPWPEVQVGEPVSPSTSKPLMHHRRKVRVCSKLDHVPVLLKHRERETCTDLDVDVDEIESSFAKILVKNKSNLLSETPLPPFRAHQMQSQQTKRYKMLGQPILRRRRLQHARQPGEIL